MVMSSRTTSSFGTNSRKPEVGFGVVGRNTLIISRPSSAFCRTSPLVAVLMKAMAQSPLRGYSTATTRVYSTSGSVNRKSVTCLTDE